MENILFRAKDEITLEWLYGYVEKKVGASGDIWVIHVPPEDPDGLYTIHEVVPETIGQYTGLADKNERMIFEGDIICFQRDNDDCPFPNKDTGKRYGRVFFSSWRASFSVAEGLGFSEMINTDLFKYNRNGNRTEVVSNICDLQAVGKKKYKFLEGRLLEDCAYADFKIRRKTKETDVSLIRRCMEAAGA